MTVYGVRLKTGEDIFFTTADNKIDFSLSAVKVKNVVEFIVSPENGEVRFGLIEWCPYLLDKEYRWSKTDGFMFEPQEVHGNLATEYEKKFSSIILPPTNIIH